MEMRSNIYMSLPGMVMEFDFCLPLPVEMVVDICLPLPFVCSHQSGLLNGHLNLTLTLTSTVKVTERSWKASVGRQSDSIIPYTLPLSLLPLPIYFLDFIDSSLVEIWSLTGLLLDNYLGENKSSFNI